MESVSDTGVTSVLIVDDAAFSRRMLRKYVEAEGYKVLEATNGQEALDMVLECQPNCILTDLLMPDVDGFQFLEALNDKGLAIPTLIISADIQESARERGKKLGAAGFINKPVKEAEIRQVVRQLLQH